MKKIIVAIALLICSTGYSAIERGNPEVVAATLILEAGGEKDPRAMAAVSEVIFNRAKAKKKTAEQICLARLQFSCWNDRSVSSGISKAKKHSKWDEAYKIATASPTSFTGGADHYHTIKVSPSWSRKLTKTVIIGNHIFYR